MAARPLHDPLAAPLPGASTETRNTTCYMCACRCGIRVHLRNGEVRYIEGNPDHPINKGVICAKGSSGIMKQYSPARLTKPLLRKPGTERGDGEFVEVSWDEAFRMLEERLGKIRATDPKRFAMFTGRDQMQALTGLFARQFGTPNYAAHGGFCSVNMAAGMIYTIGGSFWEFGGPDLERAKLFVMIGTAEDHHSNPLKIAISKFKRDGGRFISINPIRTGYSAIADEWVPIRPGTDGALFLALIHEIVALGLYDREFLARFTNAGQLVNVEADANDFGLLVRGETLAPNPDRAPEHDRTPMWWDRISNQPVPSHTEGADPYLYGEFTLPDGRKVKPAHQLLKERVAQYTPEWAATITGIPAATIHRLARELGITARDGKIELPIAWTDSWGRDHETVTGNPVAFHAMRGLAAHSNGFQTIRALAILMSLLGTIDRPGGFRHKSPFPRMVPPSAKPPNSANAVRPNTPLSGLVLGWPGTPSDLFINEDGTPVRIDKAFSWEYPLAVHGLMHNVITNAWRGDPYPIDTLLIFMANMAWNSTMNTSEIRAMLNDKHGDGPNRGEHKIPFLVVCDAFQSETTAFADLVLPDTTYLERHDVMSMLDRPISEFDGPIDSVRIPVVTPKGECKPFQEVLIELASRLKFPAFVNSDGTRKFRDYPDFITNYETEPGSGIGFLSGWRGKNGDKFLRGEPNPRQWEMYERNNCVFRHRLPVSYQYMRNWNRGYMEWTQRVRIRRYTDPIIIQIYSEVLQNFRLAAQGKGPWSRKPPAHLKTRIETFFDPLPFFYEPLEAQAIDTAEFPLRAITQRPMAMYHAWDSQNAWLRQIHAHNHLYINPAVARAAGIDDGGWMWVESRWGKVRCLAMYSEAVEPGTVWTWNAIGKAAGAWRLASDANESRRGFLLNHLISDELPTADGGRISNSDPITGQAGWYDVRVRVYRAGENEPKTTWPQFETVPAAPGTASERPRWQAFFAGKGKWR
jgi:anaerobic selenocysteine-containing dehydrogenase